MTFTFHMPELLVSKNTISGNTASREYGQKNIGEPIFSGVSWVIRDEKGKYLDDFCNEKHVERYYPGTTLIEFYGG